MESKKSNRVFVNAIVIAYIFFYNEGTKDQL